MRAAPAELAAVAPSAVLPGLVAAMRYHPRTDVRKAAVTSLAELVARTGDRCAAARVLGLAVPAGCLIGLCRRRMPQTSSYAHACIFPTPPTPSGHTRSSPDPQAIPATHKTAPDRPTQQTDSLTPHLSALDGGHLKLLAVYQGRVAARTEGGGLKYDEEPRRDQVLVA